MAQIDSTSTADISFILLVFFLLITSIDMEKGLQRLLPTPDDQEQEEEVTVERRNVLEIGIGKNGHITADGKRTDMKALAARLEGFLSKEAALDRHVISITMDAEADYDSYFQVQDVITKTYRKRRDDYARAHFHQSYHDLDAEGRKKVNEAVPQRTVEQMADETTATEGGKQ